MRDEGPAAPRETSTPASSDMALATRGTVSAPPQIGERSLRQQVVLDEETYTSGLSRIIQRDFFPDLPRLQAQNAYLTALDEGTQDEIEEAARRLVHEEARYGVLTERTRRADDGEPLTPMPMPSSTPRSDTPRPSVGTTPLSYVGDTPRSSTSMHAADVPTNLTMGQYQTRYTTEDNASFAHLMDVTRKRRREKYDWAYKAAEHETAKRQAKIEAAHHEAEAGRRLAGPSAPKGLLAPPPPPEPPTSSSHAQGALMHAPGSLTSTAKATKTDMPPPRLVHANTRLDWHSDLGMPSSATTPSTPSSSVVDAAIHGTSSPRVNGYGFVSMPSTPRTDIGTPSVAATPRASAASASRTPRPSTDILSPAARTLLQRTSRSVSTLYRANPSSTPRSARWTPTPSPVVRRNS